MSERYITAQKTKFSIEDFFSKCDQIHRTQEFQREEAAKSSLFDYSILNFYLFIDFSFFLFNTFY